MAARKTKKNIVVRAIKEDGKLYKPGDEYKGRFAAKFLKDGQLKKG
jgi:hypothetical protein